MSFLFLDVVADAGGLGVFCWILLVDGVGWLILAADGIGWLMALPDDSGFESLTENRNMCYINVIIEPNVYHRSHLNFVSLYQCLNNHSVDQRHGTNERKAKLTTNHAHNTCALIYNTVIERIKALVSHVIIQN